MKIMVEEHYCKNTDTTFLMEEIYDEKDELRRLTCIGWYAGEPNQHDTEFYSYRGVVARYGN